MSIASRIATVIAIFVATMAATTFAQDCASKVAVKAQSDIIDTALAAGQFKTLATALDTADLVSTLKGKGPFTVFAPTDAAFAKLPKATIAALLQPENRAQLTSILTYHVVSGSLTAKKVLGVKGLVTVNGQLLDIASDQDGAMVDGVRIITTDIECSNGVIHVIDSVIMPADQNIVATAKGAKVFNTLLAAATAADLAEVLSSKGPFTIFAPTDEAFAKIDQATLKSLLQPENREQLVAILKYHVVSGRVYSAAALAAGSAKTLEGSSVHVTVTDGVARVEGARLLNTDLDASNGVIHVIDTVLIPSPKKGASIENQR